MTETALVVIARSPELAKVKTRLAAKLGDKEALRIYRLMLKNLVELKRGWQGPVGLLAGGEASAWDETDLKSWEQKEQQGDGLGEIIRQGLEWGLSMAHQAIVIGSDCPLLRVEHLEDLSEQLKAAAVAFGPSSDGGYWAMGVTDHRCLDAVCAKDLPWSTPKLLETSKAKLKAAGFASAMGVTLSDCDTYEDLLALESQGFVWRSR